MTSLFDTIGAGGGSKLRMETQNHEYFVCPTCRKNIELSKRDLPEAGASNVFKCRACDHRFRITNKNKKYFCTGE